MRAQDGIITLRQQKNGFGFYPGTAAQKAARSGSFAPTDLCPVGVQLLLVPQLLQPLRVPLDGQGKVSFPEGCVALLLQGCRAAKCIENNNSPLIPPNGD